MKRESTSDDYTARILRVLEHIQQHLDSAMTPADLAELACFSPYHFQRIFRALVGESVMGHIRRLRLERSAKRLKHSDAPITEIAFAAGYENHESFTRAFGAHFSCSPSDFRRRHRPIEFPNVPSNVHFGTDVSNFLPVVHRGETMQTEIIQRPACHVAYVRHIGPYEQCGEAWERLTGWLATEGYFAAVTEMLGLCHDDPDVTDDGLIRYDACAVLGGDFEPCGSVGKKQIRGGDYARVRHVGPYTELHEVYRKLFGTWLPGSGREVADAPCLEIYWNDPDSTEPEELETDILLPLEGIDG